MTDNETKFLEWLREPDMPDDVAKLIHDGQNAFLFGVICALIEKKFLEIVNKGDH